MMILKMTGKMMICMKTSIMMDIEMIMAIIGMRIIIIMKIRGNSVELTVHIKIIIISIYNPVTSDH